MNIPLASLGLSILVLLSFIAGAAFGRYQISLVATKAWIYQQCLQQALVELESLHEDVITANRVRIMTEEKNHVVGDCVNLRLGDAVVLKTEVEVVYKKMDHWYTDYKIVETVHV